MSFKKIDMANWCRRDKFKQYMVDTPCTYSITVNINISNLLQQVKLKQLQFFPTFLFGLTYCANQLKEFRTSLDEDENVGYYEYCNPQYNIFHSETEDFTSAWSEYCENFNDFMRNYTNDMAVYRNDTVKSKPMPNKNIFYVSCIPWISFENFNLNLKYGYKYLLPIFTIGKYFEKDNNVLIPVSLLIHHASADGYHTSKFFNNLQQWCNTFDFDENN